VGKIVENRLDIRHCVAEDVKRRVGDSKKKEGLVRNFGLTGCG